MAAVLFWAGTAEASDELDASIWRRLPGLREGTQFEASCGPTWDGKRPECVYEAHFGGDRPVPLRRSSDLKPFLVRIENRAQALALVRFLSDPPTFAGGEPLPFEDAPFRELGALVGPPGEEPVLVVPADVISAYWIDPPRTAMVRLKKGEWRFVVTRYVFLNEELLRAIESGIPRRIARVEETVTPEGDYSVRIEMIPVDKDFKVKAFPRSRPPGKHPTS